MTPEQLGTAVLSFAAWSVAGLVALFISRVAYKFMTPFDPVKELVEDRNVAVGASHGLFVIASGILLHGIISGEKLAIPWWQEGLYMFGLFVGGLVFLWLGRIALNLLISFDLDDEIHVQDNTAVGILEGCCYIGFAIIVHAAL